MFQESKRSIPFPNVWEPKKSKNSINKDIILMLESLNKGCQDYMGVRNEVSHELLRDIRYLMFVNEFLHT